MSCITRMLRGFVGLPRYVGIGKWRYRSGKTVLFLLVLPAVVFLLVFLLHNDVTYIDLQASRESQMLQRCLEKAARGTEGNKDDFCVKFLQSVLNPHQNGETQNQRPAIVDTKILGAASVDTQNLPANVVTQQMDCYSDIDILSSKPHPFPNRTHMRLHYVESIAQCGHTPKLVSRYVRRADNLSLPVPNVVHFIWTHWPNRAPSEMGFIHHMAVLSVSKYIKPVHIFWHGTYEPFGYWWNRTVALVPNLYFVKWQMPEAIFGKPLIRPSFQSDILRLWLLIVHGGMYFDLDVIVLKSFDPLREYDLVEGREMRFSLANGILVSSPGSVFLRMALQAYKNFNFVENIKASMIYPNLISRLFPQHIHVEKWRLLFPTWPNIRQLYVEPYAWSDNFCIHIFGEQTFGYLIPENKEDMDRANSTLGQILRHVYYDAD